MSASDTSSGDEGGVPTADAASGASRSEPEPEPESESEPQSSSEDEDAPASGELTLRRDDWVDHFRVRRLLGKGGMGAVYLARDTRLGRLVALKLIRADRIQPSRIEGFLREAQVIARFNHPNIVIVHSIGQRDSLPYLALEHLDGETLRARMRSGRLAEKEAIRLALSIARALAEAHRHDIAHGDLKPENAMVPTDGRLRLLDFGLAQVVENVSGRAGPFGTHGYMAPELWKPGEARLEIDLFAFGVMLHELLEGDRPAGSTSVNGPPVLEPLRFRRTHSAELQAIVSACLREHPRERPAAGELVDRLERVLGAGAIDLSVEENPFRGLSSFDEKHAGTFFGRGEEIEVALERLRARPLLPVIGPSGSGKSSFVQAGIIPRLRELGDWSIASMRPGSTPFRTLAYRLTALKAGFSSREAAEDLGTEITTLARTLYERPGLLNVQLQEIARSTDTQVLLLVDQLEEVITHDVPAEEAQRFLQALAGAADDADEPWRLIFTARDDFVGRLSEGAFVKNVLVLRPLERGLLREVIERPLAQIGYGFDDPSMLERMVEDVASSGAALPLLQFACRRLWERRDRTGRRLRRSEYEAMGGVSGALARHAEGVIAGLSREQVPIARAMLLKLVNPDGTRRTRAASGVIAELEAGAAEVLDVLEKARLIVVRPDHLETEHVAELAHESLCKTWTALARWIEESREERTVVAQLEQATQHWVQRGRRAEGTWIGEELAAARGRIKALSITVPEEVNDFLEAGRRRERRRLWAAIGGMVVLAAIALGSWIQRREINLAAADMGRFDVVLEPFDWDAADAHAIAVNVAELPALDFVLHAADPHDPRKPGPPMDPDQLRLERRGAGTSRVEARAGPAFVEVIGRERAGEARCNASLIRLQSLPGFVDRTRDPPVQLRLPVPTCRATQEDMIPIPAGEMIDGGKGEPPTPFPEYVEQERQISLKRFYIDRTEVTNAAYGVFATMAPLTGEPVPTYPANKYLANAGGPRYPVTMLDAFTAQAYCEFMGKRLPSTQEWRKAARGGIYLDEAKREKNPHPRRNLISRTESPRIVANLDGPEDGFDGPAPVGSIADDVSVYGVYDLGGNVAEWSASSSVDPGQTGMRALMGAAWTTPRELEHHTLAFTNAREPRTFTFEIGLRCVIGDEEKLSPGN